MPITEIEMARDNSKDNAWFGLPLQHKFFVRDAMVGAAIGTLIVAALAALT